MFYANKMCVVKSGCKNTLQAGIFFSSYHVTVVQVDWPQNKRFRIFCRFSIVWSETLRSPAVSSPPVECKHWQPFHDCYRWFRGSDLCEHKIRTISKYNVDNMILWNINQQLFWHLDLGSTTVPFLEKLIWEMSLLCSVFLLSKKRQLRRRNCIIKLITCSAWSYYTSKERLSIHKEKSSEMECVSVSVAR